MNKNMRLELDQIKINNRALQEICNAMRTLASLDLQPMQHRVMLTPLSEYLCEIVENNEQVIFEIDKAEGKV